MNRPDVATVDSDDDDACVQRLLQNHVRYTQSPVAEAILADWARARPQFVKVMPHRAVSQNASNISLRQVHIA